MRRWAMYGLALVFYVGVLAVITSGCGKRKAAAKAAAGSQQVGRHVLAVANAVTVEHLKYLAYGGAILMVFGVLFLVARKWVPGLIAFGGGGGMAYVYASLAEYPWISVIVPVVAMVAAVVLAIYLIRNRDVLRELVAAIEKHPRVKDDIGAGDPNRQARVKRVVTPIKEGLQKEGAI